MSATAADHPRIDLSNPYRRPATVSGWLTVIGGPLLVVSIVLVVAGGYADKGGPVQVAGFVGGVLALLVLLSCPWIYWDYSTRARRVDAFRQAFAAGRYLVQWNYPQAQWDAFRRHMLKRLSKFHWISVGVGLVGMIPLFVVAGIAAGGKPMHPDGRAAMPWVCGGFLLIAGLVIWAIQASMARFKRDVRQSQPALVSTLGAYANGGWLLWGTAAGKLIRVEVNVGRDGTPPRLIFHLSGEAGMRPHEILVPAGQVEIAEKVAEAIRKAPAAEGGGGMQKAEGLMRALMDVARSFR